MAQMTMASSPLVAWWTTTLKGYCDFNFVGDQNDCKSCTSHVFTIANATISWTNGHQGYTCLSTTKAMYVATCVATKEAI